MGFNTIPVRAKKNNTEKNAPNILSTMKIFFVVERDTPRNNGRGGGSTKSLVPERNTAELKKIALLISLTILIIALQYSSESFFST